MAAFEKIEEIQAWQKARGVTKMVYELTVTGDIGRDFGLRDSGVRVLVICGGDDAKLTTRPATRGSKD